MGAPQEDERWDPKNRGKHMRVETCAFFGYRK